MAQQTLAAVRAAALDGRATNVFYRQTQLENLHTSLITEASAIQEAIIADSAVSVSEAKIEYSLALEALKARYTEIDSKKELEAEYRIANGENAADARTGAGLVLIQPTLFTLFYSVIAPMAAAIAAGNCVVVQVENTSRSLPAILKAIFRKSLDPDAFVLVQGPVRELEELGESTLKVVQAGNSAHAASSSHLTSSPTSLTVAVVDRSADFDQAAQALLNARFAFRGQSPYAPDLVLVNEFAKKDFLQALVRQMIAAGNHVTQHDQPAGRRPRNRGLKDLIADLQKAHGDDARIVSEEANGAILDIRSGSASLLEKKVTEPALLIYSVKSLDDSIDLLTGNNTTLLASYYFAEPKVAKYLSQFIPSQVSFVNHIPAEILVGPAFPLTHPVEPTTRYPTVLFSRPSPAFITATNPQSTLLVNAQVTSSDATQAAALQTLYASAVSQLPDRKGPKQFSASFGFFEQAFVTSFGLKTLTTITTIGAVVLWIRSGRTLRFGR